MLINYYSLAIDLLGYRFRKNKLITQILQNKITSLSKQNINKIFETFYRVNSRPEIELKYSNPFTLLIAVMLSAQATDKIVNRCTKELFTQYYTPQQFIALTEDGLIPYIKPIGLYRTKAKNIIKMCHQLIIYHKSQVPKIFKELISLPGVGRKTADVVLNSAFGKPTIAVDRHIFRIVKTIGLTSGKTVNEVADNLIKVIPKKYHKYAHHWLVLHGRYICKAKKQLCYECPISKYCLTFKSQQSK